MTIPPEHQAMVNRAQVFESLIQHPGWLEFVKMCGEQRDSWLANTAMNPDRHYLAAQAHTTNLLTNAVYGVIDQKDALLAELTRQELEARQGDQTSVGGPRPFHPPPQPV